MARAAAGTPPAVRRLIARCLTKDPRERLHHIADARLELQDALAAAVPKTRPARLRGRRNGCRGSAGADAVSLPWLPGLSLGGAVAAADASGFRGPPDAGHRPADEITTGSILSMLPAGGGWRCPGRPSGTRSPSSAPASASAALSSRFLLRRGEIAAGTRERSRLCLFVRWRVDRVLDGQRTAESPGLWSRRRGSRRRSR